MIDTHAHLNLKQFDRDRSEVLAACHQMGLRIINVGIDHQSSVKAVELTDQPGCYAAVGFHPGCQDPAEIDRSLIVEKTVAIGETGLDFFHRSDEAEKSRQKDLFLKHGRVAAETGRPLIIHCRLAFPELISLLSRELAGIPAVIHSFSGGLPEARELLNMGFYLGFSGLVFKLDLDEVIRSTPVERMLVETDSPFLPPPSLEEKRNAPHVGWRPVLEKISFVKKISSSEIIEQTTENAECLFNLK